MMHSMKRIAAMLMCVLLVFTSGTMHAALADSKERTNDNPGTTQAPAAEYDIWDTSVFEDGFNGGLGSMTRDGSKLLVSEANITFYIDTTGSMSYYINSVRSNITAFVEYLVTYGITVNLQLVEFRDLTCDGSNSFKQHFFKDPETGASMISTSDANVFIEEMRKLYVSGGGDWDETPTNAIYNYMPPVSDNTVSFAFLLTDAGAKESSDDPRVIDIATVSDLLLKNDIHMSVVSDTDYEPQYRQLYKPTNGLFIDINSRDYYALMLKIAEWVIKETEAVNKTFNYPGSYDKEKDATSYYFYEDDYFRESAWTYNPHLSTMSLCLELSGWGSYETSQKVWNGAERTKNAYALLNEIGFNDIERNKYWDSAPDTETVGLISAWKSIDDFTLVTLVVRGGDYRDEWSGNFVLGRTGEHDNWDKMSDHAVSYLTKYIEECKKNNEEFNTSHIKLWIVGYSRGGAIANMTSGKILTESALPWTIAKEDLYCYTFEAPQGSVKNFAGYVHLPIHNVINLNDLVPMVAMKEYNFKRYPMDYILPNLSSWNYGDAKASMLNQFAQITGGEAYVVPDYTREIAIKTSVAKIGYKYVLDVDIVAVENNDLTNNEMLSNVLRNLTNGIGNRNQYVTNVQEGLKLLLKEITGFDSSVQTDKILENFKEVFISNRFEGFRGVMSRYYDLEVSWGNIEFTNPEAAAEYFVDLVFEALTKSGFDFDRYDTTEAIITVRNTLSAVLSAFVDNPWVTIAFADNLASDGRNFFQAHYPEVTLAWLRSQDSYYTSDAFRTKYPDIMRIIRVNCPVDLSLYGPDGELVAKIVDDKVTSYNEYIGCSVNKDGEKTFRVPGDADFTIRIKATDKGTMNYQISEYTMGANEYTRARTYADIVINKGDELIAVIPAIDEAEYGDPENDGTGTAYALTKDGEELAATSDVRGDMKVKSFIVSTKLENGAGFIIGGGEYVMGSFAQVELVTNSELEADSKFIGWYVNNELVSTEKVYRFAVTQDVTIVARFDSEPGEIPPTTPGTGDGTHVGLLLMMLSVSLMLLISVSFVSRRRRLN